MSNEDIVKEFTPQDTKDIQIKSVCAFMKEFKYLLHVDGKFYSNTFWDWEKGKREDPYFKGCEVIHMSTAVRLHNSWWDSFNYNFKEVECESFQEGSVFRADPYTYKKANAAKIVKRAYLQGTKHGRVVCHKHLVKFCDSSYQYMFLKDAHKDNT